MRKAADWCILRTSGGRTLALAKSLGDAGFDVWTPAQTMRRRRPRSKVTVEIELPIMPTFVFVRADRLHDLAQVLNLPMSPHPQFSIFRYLGKYPCIAEHEVAGMRKEEARYRVAQLKTKRHVFPKGDTVRVTDGPAAGMSGVVQDGDGKFAVVAFGGRFRLKIATFLLRTDEVHSPVALTGIAA
jgi:transcription antitermination factor NusG